MPTLADIAQQFALELRGDGEVLIVGVATLADAGVGRGNGRACGVIRVR